MSMSALQGAMQMAGGWRNVTAPDAAFSWLPFTIEQDGRNFRAKNWDVSDLRPTGGTDYYVDPVSGDNANTGLSWGQALKSIRIAVGKAGVGTVHLASGTYGYADADGGWIGGLGNAHTLICESGDAVLTPRLLHTYSLVSNHYEATATTQITSVMDLSISETNGQYKKYNLVADAATVDATPGSFYWAANVLYLRTLDDRAPDSDIYTLRTVSSGLQIGVTATDTRYVEGIKFLFCTDRMVRCFYNSALNPGQWLHVYFKNCAFSHQISSPVNYDIFDIDGHVDCILQGCVAEYGILDGFNYHVTPFTEIPRAIEIDCIGRYCGTSGSTNNGSSTHEAAPVVRIMGKYHDSYGAVIGDVGGASVWCLGTEAYNSLTATATRNVGFLVADGGPTKMWLDSCYAHDSTYDLAPIEGEAIYIRNFVGGAGSNYDDGGGGTVTPY